MGEVPELIATEAGNGRHRQGPVLSDKTVHNDVTSILAKLGLENRAAANVAANVAAIVAAIVPAKEAGLGGTGLP